MKVADIVNVLGLSVQGGREGLIHEVTGGYTSDLLSDVMGHAGKGVIWITLQTHKNVVAIASLKEIAAIILVKGYQADDEMLAHCNKEEIPVLGTLEESFEISGRLFQLFANHDISR